MTTYRLLAALTLDDYNVQEAYVGQNVAPILEIEVECNGINVA